MRSPDYGDVDRAFSKRITAFATGIDAGYGGCRDTRVDTQKHNSRGSHWFPGPVPPSNQFQPHCVTGVSSARLIGSTLEV